MKHLRKDDGYVLVYVLIVFTILSFAALNIYTAAVKNLQAQKAAVARMEARYEAEGYLQQFLAEVEAIEDAEGIHANPSDAKAAMENMFLTAVKEIPAENALDSWLTIEDASAPEKLILKIKSKDNAVQIHATVNLSLDSVSSGGGVIPDSDPVAYEPYVYTLKQVSITGYESYDISYSEGGGT